MWAVFGVDLEFLLKREAGGSAVSLGAIPSFLEKCLLEVETRGLTEVGICKWWCSKLGFLMCSSPVLDRIAGATSEVTALKDGLNRGRAIFFSAILYSKRFP